MELGEVPPTHRVACPGNVDYIQGEGDFSMRATVRWNPSDGDLAVALVDSDDNPYVVRLAPHNSGESISVERGLWKAVGGNHRHFIRVKNESDRPIDYEVTVEGVWGE